jgi:copper chaperone CopZ
MKKILIIILTIIFVFTACADTPPAPVEETENITTELTVWGMTCGRCENKIINALSEIDGVISVSADSKADKVTVEHDPELDIDTINSIITGEGFNIP